MHACSILLGDEIRAVIDVELLGNAADDPFRVRLAPDRLPQRQRGVEGARRVEAQEVAGDCAAMIVENDGQPRAHRRAVVIEGEDIEHGMVRLPHLVRGRGFAPMHQLVLVAVRGRIGNDHDPACWYRPHDTRDDRVARNPASLRRCEFLHLPVNRSDRGSRALDGEIAGKPDQIIRQVQPAPVAAAHAGETGKTFGTVAPKPSLQCPFAYRAGAREVRKRDAVGQVRFENAVTLDRPAAGRAQDASPLTDTAAGKENGGLSACHVAKSARLQNRDLQRKPTR